MKTIEHPVRYADLTINDRNRAKRYLQRRRLRDSLRMVTARPGAVLDLGAGDGELARLVASRYSPERLVCYEPSAELRQQAQANLADRPAVEIVESLDGLAPESFDLVFCLEVLEHLPDRELEELLGAARRLLRPAGRMIVGVPNEIHLAALARGLFRWARGVRNFDTVPGHILQASLGRPPRAREAVTVDGGRSYYRRHMGFDHRRLRQQIGAHFQVQDRYGSPCPRLPLWMNFEVYFVCGRKNGS